MANSKPRKKGENVMERKIYVQEVLKEKEIWKMK